MLALKPVHTKRFGQHFLHDKHYIQRIIEAVCVQPTDCFVEIGPGGGALTEHLLPLVHQLVAIEIDPLLCQGLEVKFHQWKERFRLYQADALAVNSSHIGYQDKKIRLISNLPYNVATPLLFHWLTKKEQITDAHVMVQKEVADRLVAHPGSKIYGRLSVMMQYYCDIKTLFKVSPGAFLPPPQVDSAVVRLIPRDRYALSDKEEHLLTNIVRIAFSQRRKTISNSLRSLTLPKQALLDAEIDPTARAEMLSVEDYVRLASQCIALGYVTHLA